MCVCVCTHTYTYIHIYLKEKLQNTNSCWARSPAVVYNDKWFSFLYDLIFLLLYFHNFKENITKEEKIFPLCHHIIAPLFVFPLGGLISAYLRPYKLLIVCGIWGNNLRFLSSDTFFFFWSRSIYFKLIYMNDPCFITPGRRDLHA